MRRSLSDLKYEGFRNLYTLSSSPQVDDAEIERQPLRIRDRGHLLATR